MDNTINFIRKKVFSYPYLNSFTCYYYFDNLDKTLQKINNLLCASSPRLKLFYISLICEVSTLSKNSYLVHYFSMENISKKKGKIREEDLKFLKEGLRFLYYTIKDKRYNFSRLKINRGILNKMMVNLDKEMKGYTDASNEYAFKLQHLEPKYVSRMGELQLIMSQICKEVQIEEGELFGVSSQLSYYIKQYKSIFDRLYESYLRVVYKEAKDIVKSKIDAFPSAFQNGGKGLIKAIEYFDPYKNYSFKTYASGWIRKLILEESDQEVNIIPVANSVWRKYRKFEKIRAKNHNPNINDFIYISNKTGYEVKDIEGIYKDIENKRVDRLDAPIDKEGKESNSLIDYIPQTTFSIEKEENKINTSIMGKGIRKKILFLLFGFTNEADKSKIPYNTMRDETVRQLLNNNKEVVDGQAT